MDIINFYNGDVTDRGFTIEEVWQRDNRELENRHDFIQWIFPLKIKGVNPTAPTTNDGVIAAFRTNRDLQDKMRRSLRTMLRFYGFTEDFEKTDSFEQRSAQWMNPGNHNYRRITRILRSLMLHGLSEEGKGFFEILTEVYEETPGRIGESTFQYWKSAANS